MYRVPLQALPLPVGALLGIIGFLLVGLGVREMLGALRYRLGRPTAIGDLTVDSGRVVVSGVARRTDAVVDAPLSGESCLAYSWRVTELRTQRGFDGSIDTWGQGGEAGRGAVPFLVEDDTGRVLVETDGATFRLAEEWVEDPVDIPDERTENSSVRHLADQLLGVETHGRRYYESRLNDGETVTVLGHAESDAGRPDDRRRDLGVVLDGTLVADATPNSAASRGVRQGAISVAAGLFILVVVGVFVLGA